MPIQAVIAEEVRQDKRHSKHGLRLRSVGQTTPSLVDNGQRH